MQLVLSLLESQRIRKLREAHSQASLELLRRLYSRGKDLIRWLRCRHDLMRPLVGLDTREVLLRL